MAPRFAAGLFASLMIGSAGTACAQSDGENAMSSLTVGRSLSIATVRPLRLEMSPGDAVMSLTGVDLGDGPAMIQISGDPGRVYRVRMEPAAEGSIIAVIDDLRIMSANTGDISVSRVSHMDQQGRDVLRVSGRLRRSVSSEADAFATLPFSIDYE